MHLDLGESCQIAFQKGFTIRTPCKQQLGFTEWLLGARPMPGPCRALGTLVRNGPGPAAYIILSRVPGQLLELPLSSKEGEAFTGTKKGERPEDILDGGGGLARPRWPSI